MFAQHSPERVLGASTPNAVQRALGEQAMEVRHVGRRPILDGRGEVHGYELLFWHGHEPALGAERELAARALLGEGIVFGVEELTSGYPAFVECAADTLGEEWVQGLRPSLTVLELAADAAPTPGLLAACRKLRRSGFRLVLDGFTGEGRTNPLLEWADYVKVDVSKGGPGEQRSFSGRLWDFPAHPVAMNVETQEQYMRALREGFELFQGYYFCRPELDANYKMPANQLVHMEILEAVQEDPVDLHRLSQLVKCDTSLTYRVLRLVNSPLCAMRQQVTSIQSALLLLGEETARRLAMLAIAGDLNTDQPTELLRMALERGRFCELGAKVLGLAPAEQYLIGMVSMFPAMLRISMEEVIRMLPLRTEASKALLGGGNREGILLDLLLRQERGEWAAMDAILQSNGLGFEPAMRCFAASVEWANAALKSAA